MSGSFLLSCSSDCTCVLWRWEGEWKQLNRLGCWQNHCVSTTFGCGIRLRNGTLLLCTAGADSALCLFEYITTATTGKLTAYFNMVQ